MYNQALDLVNSALRAKNGKAFGMVGGSRFICNVAKVDGIVITVTITAVVNSVVTMLAEFDIATQNVVYHPSFSLLHTFIAVVYHI